MTPRDYLDEVAHPNMVEALKSPNDMRAIVNAILSLDALAGIIHAHAPSSGQMDDDYRESLAHISRSYRVLRDAAASLKHGNLRHRKHGLARLLRAPAAFRAVPNRIGLFRVGDRIGGQVVVIEFDPGPGYVRASNIIANSFRMLKRIVEGEAAQTDVNDRGTFFDERASRRVGVS